MDMLRLVKTRVNEDSKGMQMPWSYDNFANDHPLLFKHDSIAQGKTFSVNELRKAEQQFFHSLHYLDFNMEIRMKGLFCFARRRYTVLCLSYLLQFPRFAKKCRV